MKDHRLAYIIFIALSLISDFSCKKKNNADPLGGSDIVIVNYTNTNGTATYYRIVYDISNNVDSIIYTGGGSDTGNDGHLAFNYLNSSYIITNENNNSTTVDINTNLMIDTVFGPGTALSYILYYGSQVGSVNTEIPSGTYPYYTTNTYNYTYSNGDIASIDISGVSTTYDYNTNRNGQLGDPQRIQQFLTYGRAYTSSVYLATNMYVNGTWQEAYSYQFDGQGRITQLTKVINNGSGAVNDTARYAYLYNY